MPGQQGHRFDQRLDDEEVFFVLRVDELEAVDQLGDPVLDLDPGVDLHEVMAVTIDDTLEGRCGIEPDGDTEALRFLFHPLEDFQVRLQGLLPGP